MSRDFSEVVNSNGCVRPYIVAEINTSHFGRMELAKDAIRRAAQTGADCVKFQSWKPESLYTSVYLQEHRIEGRLYERFSLSDEVIQELSQFSEENGIAFASTPYSHDEVINLVNLRNVPFVKIASMDLTNPDLLTFAAQSGKPLVISTGMANEFEIEEAVSSVRIAPSVCLLHCVSLYPTPSHLANLRTIGWLIKKFSNHSVGYSDHTIGSTAAVIATALGAKLIEKHVSIDKARAGFDNEMAMSFEEFGKFVSDVGAASELLGEEAKVLSAEEQIQSARLRRSAYARFDIAAGQLLSREMVEFKRPGGGIDMKAIDSLIGTPLVRSKPKGSRIDVFDVCVMPSQSDWREPNVEQ